MFENKNNDEWGMCLLNQIALVSGYYPDRLDYGVRHLEIFNDK